MPGIIRYRKCIFLLSTILIVGCFLFAFNAENYLKTPTSINPLPILRMMFTSTPSKTKNVKFQPNLTGKPIIRPSLSLAATNDTNVRAVKVLILAYMRSGSSLMGQLFSEYKESAYFFEPLRGIDRAFKRNQGIKKINGEIRNLKGEEQLMEEFVDNLKQLFSCCLHRVATQTLFEVAMKRSTMGKGIFNCRKENNAETCLEHRREQCAMTKLLAIKVIRLPMTHASLLLDSDKHLKIIHLIRDPRAILSSRRNIGVFQMKSLKNISRSLCERMLQDVESSKRLIQNYSDRIATLKYEDLAIYPLSMVTALYRFLYLSLPDEVGAWVRLNMLQSEQNQNRRPFSTIRRNAKDVMFKWRKQVTLNFTKTVDSACAKLYSQIGYEKVDDLNVLRNKSISLRSTPTTKLNFIKA